MSYCGFDSNEFVRWCQRIVTAALIAVPLAAPAGAVLPKAAEPVIGNLAAWRLGGSLSLNWRNVGPREPDFETQIQNEVYLADMYFHLRGPVVDGVPFRMEFHMPTGSQGQLLLYQFHFDFVRLQDWDLKLGKFVVPFGRYNELYSPKDFLTVTRPLLYSSPDSLDLVVRVNSPRPVFSSGYTDIGAQLSHFPRDKRWFLPKEVTAFVVNGFGETSNRSRAFPKPENLGIPPPPGNGVAMDFGHENNNLADNNNNKAAGGRMVFGFGDLGLPWPISEAHGELNGVTMGVSGMTGFYDLEQALDYSMLGFDLGFEYSGVNVSGEYLYAWHHFKAPVMASSTTLVFPTVFSKEAETLQGFFVQASFPVLRRPGLGKRVTGVVVFNKMERRGPLLDLLLNQTVNGTTFESIGAFKLTNPRTTTRITKFTAGLAWSITNHFTLKTDYSYWVMRHASTGEGKRDIYQGAMSVVMNF